jgi:hypothetical protein
VQRWKRSITTALRSIVAKSDGLFFDHLEKEDLKTLEGAEDVDIGDEFVGAKHGLITDVQCPKCLQTMAHVVIHEPFEITFEQCATRHGTYFDAGEFRDYMEDEILDAYREVPPAQSA